MQLHIEKNSTELSKILADWIMEHILDTLQKQDRYTWALSGGNSPQRLYELLANPPYREQIPWQKLHIFWGDERVVPFDDPRNNAKMAYDMLLHHVPIPPHQIHVMRTDIPPQQAAAEYERLLHQYFDHSPASFDLALLGMGEDGHTLSLFPGTPVVHEQKAWVTAFYLPPQQMYRITLTAPITNKATRVAFLAPGENKAATLKSVLEGPYDPDRFPSQQIKPTTGQLHWFIDEGAAAKLQHK